LSEPSFDPLPSTASNVAIDVARAVPADATIVGVLVAADGPVPAELGVERAALDAMGFTGEVGNAVTLTPVGGVVRVAVGIGDASVGSPNAWRDAAGALGRASQRHGRLAVVVPDAGSAVAQAVVEGLLLARYRYESLRSTAPSTPLTAVTVVGPDVAEATAGAETGRALATATMIARDLANTPHSHLTASAFADLAERRGPSCGLRVEVTDEDGLIALGCGGLLGVNAGSTEPPRMIKLTYEPDGTAIGHLGLVGKGVMYDSGGLAIKPGDEIHAQMKNDMTGAASVFGAMCALRSLGCRAKVTAWLMCTDNMPSGTAMALGDVITIRGGTTVEVINTDAEGRLVMADALVLATEEGCDAIVDIATLTGACMRALGTGVAGLMGNRPDLVAQVAAAGDAVDEPVWELPLVAKYRKDIASPIADLRNLGVQPNGGAIHAGLFLEAFVGDTPWAHVDIAGVAQTPADQLWHTTGCSGFGARLLARFATDFEAVG